MSVDPRGDSHRVVRTGQLEVRRRARWFELGEVAADELWIVLHGYGQLARPFLDSCAPLARPGRRIVAPEALSRFYLRGGRGPIGATWMTREAREDEIADYVEYLEALVARLAAPAGRPTRLNVLGFSQGVATAWRWVSAGAQRPERLIACGGGAPPDLDLVAAREQQLEVVISAGERDEAFSPQQAREERDRLQSAGLLCTLELHGGGHELDPQLLARW